MNENLEINETGDTLLLFEDDTLIAVVEPGQKMPDDFILAFWFESEEGEAEDEDN